MYVICSLPYSIVACILSFIDSPWVDYYCDCLLSSCDAPRPVCGRFIATIKPCNLGRVGGTLRAHAHRAVIELREISHRPKRTCSL